jgi:hypothetical protein
MLFHYFFDSMTFHINFWRHLPMFIGFIKTYCPFLAPQQFKHQWLFGCSPRYPDESPRVRSLCSRRRLVYVALFAKNALSFYKNHNPVQRDRTLQYLYLRVYFSMRILLIFTLTRRRENAVRSRFCKNPDKPPTSPNRPTPSSASRNVTSLLPAAASCPALLLPVAAPSPSCSSALRHRSPGWRVVAPPSVQALMADLVLCCPVSYSPPRCLLSPYPAQVGATEAGAGGGREGEARRRRSPCWPTVAAAVVGAVLLYHLNTDV